MGTFDEGDPDTTFPLTEIQYAYWVGRGASFVLGNVAPHAYFELDGRRLDPALLTETWQQLVRRHEMLRAVVGDDGRQRVLPDVEPFEIVCVDLRDTTEDERERCLAAVRDNMSSRVYDAGRWPLFDVRISRLPGHDRLHISLDLLMVDLASVAVLFDEWSLLYRSPDLELPPVDITFRDYVLALEGTRGTPRYQRALEYWTGRAETLAPPPDLPLAQSPARVHKPVFTHREFKLPIEAWQQFQSRARHWGLTPSAVLATAFSEVLTLWSGTSRFVLNLTLFNRLPLVLGDAGSGHQMVHPHLRRVVGDFTSICLLEMDMGGGVPFVERARRTQRQLQQDLRHRYVSALHTLRERRRLGLQTGFETVPVVFTSGLGTVADLADPLESFGDIGYRVSQTPQVWLDHQAVDVTGTLELSWDAVEELFPDGLLDDMFDTYCRLVERLAVAEDSWTTDAVVAIPERQAATRDQANDVAPPLSTGRLHEPMLARSVLSPQAPAVISSAGTVSYRELAAAAGEVAAALTAADQRTDNAARVDTLVGVVADKGADQVIAAYGVLLAGNAYLPVNPAVPARRLGQILADGEATAVVTDARLDAQLEWPADVRRIRVPDHAVGTAHDPDKTGPARPEDLAYVIYTSGSTGAPKGVMIEHRAAYNTVVDINERFGVTATDRVFGLADLGFDLSVYDLFGTHAAGAALVLPDPDKVAEPAHWAEIMHEHGVTVWNSVPAQMQMLVEHLEVDGTIPADLRLMMLSGDWIPVDLAERVTALWPKATVISMGGATEAAIWSIWHEIDAADRDAPSVPYGKPLRGQGFHVLDDRLQPCPTWVPGEMHIEGRGLARGYWRNPDATAASFVTHPSTGVRLYRTGDYGRYLPNGDIQFLGRRDGQVKIGGHRIELGEVEAVLSRHPGVERAVVVKSHTDTGSAQLAGYVVPSTDHAEQLFATELDTSEVLPQRWRAMDNVAVLPPSGPAGATLLSVWDQLNKLHAEAAATAVRALGLPHRVGDSFDPAQLTRNAAVPARYERWLDRAVEALRASGYLAASADGVTVTRELPTRISESRAREVRRALRDTLDVAEDVIDWFLTVADNLAGVLTQDVHSAELYANDRTPGVYERLFDAAYRVAAAAVKQIVDDWPADRPLRILEVGAGYGSLTKRLLPLLPADRTEYVFTDISTFFLENARAEFAEHPFVRYELLDLDHAVETQSLGDHTADLVIAASVLHDAKRIRPSLGHLRSVLAPHGLLLMVEETAFHPWFDLTMGLQQGFDGFADTHLRVDHPLLGIDCWRTELAAAGYAETAVLTRSGGTAAVGFDVLVAQGPAHRRRFDQEVLRTFVADQLPKYMVPAHVRALDELPLSRTGKIDRGALAKAIAGSARTTPLVPPRTDRQRKLVEIWCEVLRVSQVGITDDFLEAGGDSLLAARLVAQIRAAFDIPVPVSVVLQYPSVEALDGYLDEVESNLLTTAVGEEA